MRKTIIIRLSCVAVLFAGYAGFRTTGSGSPATSSAWPTSSWPRPTDETCWFVCSRGSAPIHNLDATRMMAQFSAGTRPPSAVLRWSRVVELNPRSLDDRLAMANGLILGDYATATNTLAGVILRAGKPWPSHVAGDVALAPGQPVFAEVQPPEARGSIRKIRERN